jgi:hypothetical protein
VRACAPNERGAVRTHQTARIPTGLCRAQRACGRIAGLELGTRRRRRSGRHPQLLVVERPSARRLPGCGSTGSALSRAAPRQMRARTVPLPSLPGCLQGCQRVSRADQMRAEVEQAARLRRALMLDECEDMLGHHHCGTHPAGLFAGKRKSTEVRSKPLANFQESGTCCSGFRPVRCAARLVAEASNSRAPSTTAGGLRGHLRDSAPDGRERTEGMGADRCGGSEDGGREARKGSYP